MKNQILIANKIGRMIAFCLLVSVAMMSCNKTTDPVTPQSTAISEGVPVTVADAFFAEYPTATPIIWQSVDGQAWEAKFTQQADTLTAFVEDDGTFLDGGKMISTTLLPTTISNYLSSTYAGGAAKEAIVYQANKVISGYKVVEKLSNNRLAAVAFDKNNMFLSNSALYAFGKTDYFGMKPESISQANLPATIQTYLAANYGAYTFKKAFQQKNIDGTTKGFGVVMTGTDGTSVAVVFDANGNFLKANKIVQKTAKVKPDTLSQSALPAAIPTYLSANYPNYTFLKALSLKNADSTVKGYLVRIMKSDSSKVGVSFDVNGNFLKEIIPKTKVHSKPDSVSQANLPSAVTTYLTTNYANYTFGKAFSVKDTTGNIANYVVIIQANSNTYSVVFDGQGNFKLARQLQLPNIIATANIPVALTTYLTTNFAGYINLQVIGIKC